MVTPTTHQVRNQLVTCRFDALGSVAGVSEEQLGIGDDLPKVATQKELQALLEANGWTKTVGGKHNVKMEKLGERPITLPMHKGAKYGVGLTAGILRQAGLKGATAKEI